jgi:transposase
LIARKDSSQPAKRQRYDVAFRLEALRFAGESCSRQAAAHALNIDYKSLYEVAEGSTYANSRSRQGVAKPGHGGGTARATSSHALESTSVEYLKNSLPFFIH